MKFNIEHKKYGTIEYTESFWSGKKELGINSSPYKRIDKTIFTGYLNNELISVQLKGNMITGVKVYIESDIIQVVPKMGLFEFIILIFGFVLPIIWGASPSLVQTLPLVGGGIGGLIYGFISLTSMVFLKKQNKLLYKILLTLGSIILCYLIGSLIGYCFLQLA